MSGCLASCMESVSSAAAGSHSLMSTAASSCQGGTIIVDVAMRDLQDRLEKLQQHERAKLWLLHLQTWKIKEKQIQEEIAHLQHTHPKPSNPRTLPPTPSLACQEESQSRTRCAAVSPSSLGQFFVLFSALGARRRPRRTRTGNKGQRLEHVRCRSQLRHGVYGGY